MTAIERVLDRLERVRRNGTSSLASCPVPSHGKGNGDRNPSLSVTEKDGKVLLNCMSGCHVQDVMVSLGLDWSDLRDEPITTDRGEKVAEWTYLHRDGSPYMIAERWQTSTGKRFVQRLPEAARAGLPSGFKPALYRLPKVLAAVKTGEPIWFVEGEKCVHAAEHLGLTATCGPGGVNNWHDYYANWLMGASLVNIVADNDTPGRAFAGLVAAMLRSKGIPVKTWAVAVPGDKADIYDHVLAGKGVEDLVPLRITASKPDGITPKMLMNTEYPPVTWVVPQMLPTGTAVLAGAPKAGKSLWALDLALGVASGQRCLEQITPRQGSVLYLSLDSDSYRRLARRTRSLVVGRGVRDDLPMEFHTDWPTGEEGIRACIEWAEIEREEGRRPLLVVADTLTMIEPNWAGGSRGQMGDLYSHTVRTLSPWAQMADEQDICLLFVHHSRKSGSVEIGGWQERILGSRGLAASTNTMLMLDMEKDSNKGMLRYAGRDVGAKDLQIEREGMFWNCIETPEVQRHLSAVPPPTS